MPGMAAWHPLVSAWAVHLAGLAALAATQAGYLALRRERFIQTLHQARLAASNIIPVQDTFGGRAVKLANGLANRFGCRLRARLNNNGPLGLANKCLD